MKEESVAVDDCYDFRRVDRTHDVGDRVESVRHHMLHDLLLEGLEVTVAGELGFQPFDTVRAALGLRRDGLGSVLSSQDGDGLRILQSGEARVGFPTCPCFPRVGSDLSETAEFGRCGLIGRRRRGSDARDSLSSARRIGRLGHGALGSLTTRW